LDAVQDTEQVLNAARRSDGKDQSGLAGNHQFRGVVGADVISAKSAVVVNVVGVTKKEAVKVFEL
jgi:hypothetical protein